MANAYERIADKALVAIESIVEGTLDSYTFSGRTFTYQNLSELVEIEQVYRRKANLGQYGRVSYAHTGGRSVS